MSKIKTFLVNNKLGVAVALILLITGVLTMLLFHSMLGKI